MTLNGADRRAELVRHGREYGRLRFAIGFTLGLQGDDAKVSMKWQSHPHLLADADHGAAILVGRGMDRNPVVSLRAANLVGIDIDGEAGRVLCRKLVPEGFPPTVTAQTGRADGGLHLYYRPPTGISHDAKIEFGEKLKLSSDGYLVIPPATHGETGREYAFLEGHAPWDRPIAILPASIVSKLERAESGGHRTPASDQPTAEGGRHDRLMRLGCAMRRRGACLQAIEAALLAENAQMCIPPQPTDIVIALADDLHRRYGPVQP